MSKLDQTFTLTFGDQGENHKGMQKIGKMAKSGFSLADITEARIYFEKKGCKVEVYQLNKLLDGVDIGKAPKPQDAYILIARDGANALLDDPKGASALYKEQELLEKDTKAFMYGRVVDKKARSNLCFSIEPQEPDYENGKGRIIAYESVPVLSKLRVEIGELFKNGKAKNMIVEGNYYYDIEKCYIGFHGDAERRKVIGVRLGASFKFHYQWFGIPEYDEEASKKAKAKKDNSRDRFTKKLLGPRFEITLNHGDVYIMSEKAVGTDWMSKKDITLRHAAGDPKCDGLKKVINMYSVGKSFFTRNNKVVYKRDEEGFVVVEFVD